MTLAIKLSNISKSFPGVKANDDISFDIKQGTIHAIVGENGAGKSTLMKILYGMQKQDSGSINIFSEQVKFLSPKDAISKGIGMVHQHFMLADNLSVFESIVLGIDKASLKKMNKSKYRKEIDAITDKYSMPLETASMIDELGVGEKQRVEIIKVLFRGAKILILDEPTAVLVPQEVKELFSNLKQLKDSGVTILFISHKLDEVLEIADEISVMRAGKYIDTVQANNVSKIELAEMMIGENLPSPPKRENKPREENALSVEDITSATVDGKKAFKNINFSIKQGEIVGIAGVEGNGQRELAESILGVFPIEKGKITLNNQEINLLNTRERREFGISFIPEDRQSQGLLMDVSLSENMILGRQSTSAYKSKYSNIIYSQANQDSQLVIENYDVRTPGNKTLALALSGGNQQKFVVGRELEDNPKLLIASQPTRGIDIGAQSLIWNKLRDARDSGLGVLLISADLDELIGLSDRIHVIYEGEFVKEINPQDATPELLGGYMTGLKS
ncbi:MAG: ABC transporter ATP-binding protein [Candidatus Actinomarina sp.]|nr:ABC transporter ATP-binding protein [Candidatus Actinomarina sp.]MDG1740248.1 ABC transporter ATP-binding protein [Candidatus Actinomarina sp.]